MDKKQFKRVIIILTSLSLTACGMQSGNVENKKAEGDKALSALQDTSTYDNAATQMSLAGASKEEQEAIKNAKAEMINSRIYNNMRVVQIAAEVYAVEHGNTYAANPDDLLPFIKKDSPNGIINPLTKANGLSLGNVVDIENTRANLPITMPAGQITYNLTADGKDYAIMGAGADGKALLDSMDKSKTLVVSSK
jgi:hypothetical protein